jgi:hypothetical protein
MASESNRHREAEPDETIDIARLRDPDVLKRRDEVVALLVAMFRRMEHFLDERVCDAWDRVRRLEPEAAADIDHIDSRLTRIAIKVIDGRTPADDLEEVARKYVLFWLRAVAALQLRELTCSRCHGMTETVAERGHRAARLCLRCWKATA